jgi:DNA repair protein RecO (recombination protein O)
MVIAMQEEKTEGIVLRSQDYKERHRIITLFSPQGLISLIVKNISRKNARLLSLTTPFSHGEYVYQYGKSDLFNYCDGTLLDDHLHLRQSLKSLKAAGTLANAILASQMAGKPAPALFALYRSYHKQIRHFDEPAPLLASFFLKLLKHEGLISISLQCANCGTAPALCLSSGESFCSQHTEAGSIAFSPAEWEMLLALEQVQQFSALRTLELSPSLTHKIQALFLSRTES